MYIYLSSPSSISSNTIFTIFCQLPFLLYTLSKHAFKSPFPLHTSYTSYPFSYFNTFPPSFLLLVYTSPSSSTCFPSNLFSNIPYYLLNFDFSTLRHLSSLCRLLSSSSRSLKSMTYFSFTSILFNSIHLSPSSSLRVSFPILSFPSFPPNTSSPPHFPYHSLISLQNPTSFYPL